MIASAAIFHDANTNLPGIDLIIEDQNGNCVPSIEFAGFQTLAPYDFFEFYVDTDGVYTFSQPAENEIRIISVFTADDFVPALACDNFQGSSAVDLGGSIVDLRSSLSITLESGVRYLVACYSYFGPQFYTLSMTGVGNIYLAKDDLPDDYQYIYAAVDVNSGIVKAVSATADFQSLPIGEYQICGLSYKATGPTPPENLDINDIVNQSLNDVLDSDDCIVASTQKKSLRISCGEEKTI